jgi:subtilisin family serine protease
VTVAVLDSGIDATHPDLAGSIISAYKLDDQTGTLASVAPSTAPWSDHGTRVASLISSRHPDIGIAPDAKLVDIRLPYSLSYAHLLQALKEVAFNPAFSGVVIVNLSVGVSSPTDEVSEAFCDLLDELEANGVLVVVAVGNRGLFTQRPWCPADLPGGLAVGGTTRHGRVSSASLSGRYPPGGPVSYSKPDLVAPGEDVYTCSPGGSCEFADGTSFAAAIVSGIAALAVENLPPTSSVAALRAALLAGCVLVSGQSRRQGAGLVQA